jgi:hypothetical protein
MAAMRDGIPILTMFVGVEGVEQEGVEQEGVELEGAECETATAAAQAPSQALQSLQKMSSFVARLTNFERASCPTHPSSRPSS